MPTHDIIPRWFAMYNPPIDAGDMRRTGRKKNPPRQFEMFDVMDVIDVIYFNVLFLKNESAQVKYPTEDGKNGETKISWSKLLLPEEL